MPLWNSVSASPRLPEFDELCLFEMTGECTAVPDFFYRNYFRDFGLDLLVNFNGADALFSFEALLYLALRRYRIWSERHELFLDASIPFAKL